MKFFLNRRNFLFPYENYHKKIVFLDISKNLARRDELTLDMKNNFVVWGFLR
jgi:hypothetical protein